MKESLSERFARDRGAPQQVDGQTVQNIYRHRISSGQQVHIRRIQSVASPVQGLRLKVDQGSLLVNGQKLKDVVLWADSAPAEVHAICESRSASVELRAWNCWRDSAGTMQAWIGDAGMVIEEIGNRARLKCSAGSHPFSPADLEIEIEFE
jgi:hypothetical protein